VSDRAGARVQVLTPQVLLPVLAFGFGVVLLVVSWPEAVPPAPTLMFEAPVVQQRAVEVAYVVVDADGLERPGFVTALLEQTSGDPHQTLNAALAGLVADLSASGIWPPSVPAPTGYLIEVARRRVAVVDVAPLPAGALWPTELEWAALRSLLATAQRLTGAADVRVTVGGFEQASLWGKIALPGGP
jgi:hypothetical protein